MDHLSIVPIEDIPKKIVACPIDNLLELYKICLQMQELCLKEQGVGLSAVQTGINWQLFIIRYIENEIDSFRFFLNCDYVAIGDEKKKSFEACLSIKNSKGGLRHFQIDRHAKIKVEGLELIFQPDLHIESVVLELDDYYSFVFQHEIEHHQGILISDPGKGIEYEMW